MDSSNLLEKILRSVFRREKNRVFKTALELNRRADEAISACDSAIRIIKSISRQYPVDYQDKEPISWKNSKRVIALHADGYCDFFTEVKNIMEDAKREFELSRRFSDHFYEKCRYIDRQLFDELYLVRAVELSADIALIVHFTNYYQEGYEAAHPEKEE